MSPDAFMEYVRNIARWDWHARRIMLPSVVVAQAVKKSARGTSELAQKANALFGIKKNGWTGRTYIKAATEQRPDGQAPEGKLWVVQLGVYRSRKNAEAFRKELESRGIISLLKLYDAE